GVEAAMRYGEPAVVGALGRLAARGAGAAVVVPLFPQQADATWASAVRHVERTAEALGGPALTVVPPFHDHPAFLDAAAARARPVLTELGPDRVLFSFHGLPERHCRKADPSGGHCLAT